MIDIVSFTSGKDIGVMDTQTCQAANILSIQVGSLEYAPDIGIDLKFFMSSDFEFQNEAFKTYLIQVLANRGINISDLKESVQNLFSTYNLELKAGDGSSGLGAR